MKTFPKLVNPANFITNKKLLGRCCGSNNSGLFYQGRSRICIQENSPKTCYCSPTFARFTILQSASSCECRDAVQFGENLGILGSCYFTKARHHPIDHYCSRRLSFRSGKYFLRGKQSIQSSRKASIDRHLNDDLQNLITRQPHM